MYFVEDHSFSFSVSTLDSYINLLPTKYLHEVNSRSLLIHSNTAGSSCHFTRELVILMSHCSVHNKGMKYSVGSVQILQEKIK